MGGVKSAVVFASYVDDEAYLPFCARIVQLWQQEFADSDIYVGINPCRCQREWTAMLDGSGLRVRYAVTPAPLLLPSDASAFQAALGLLQAQPTRYDYVWFGHTKGATSGDYATLTAHLIELFLKKEAIITSLQATGCGLYALAASIAPRARDGCSRYLAFRYTALPIFCVFTFYVFLGRPLHSFLDRCDRSFFTERLPNAHFFEGDFPQAAFRQGYEPCVRKIVQVHTGDLSTIVSDERTWRKTLAAWRAINRLKPRPDGYGCLG